jgi:hypothetical protein
VSYDRYKTCRRHCSILKEVLDKHKDLINIAKEYFEQKKATIRGDTKFLGENLPDNLLGCNICNFIAKSERGLRIHMRRTHKLPPKEV